MIQKQNLNINFAKGIDTKTDPWQVSADKFTSLENQIFTKGGRLTKRNGYPELSSVASPVSYVTTFNGNLTALGKDIQAYNAGSSTWVSKGAIEPMSVSTLPLIANNYNQTQCDAAVSSNGLICTVFTETDGSNTFHRYVVADVNTGQNIVAPTNLTSGAGSVSGSSRVFLLGNYFVIVFTAGTTHLQYISVSITNPTVVTAATDLASSYVASTTLSWDGVVNANNLYLAYNTTTGGQAVKVTYLTQSQAATGLGPVAPVTFATYKATLMSLCADTSTSQPVIWVNFYRSDTSLGFALAVDANLNTILAPTATITSGTILNLASSAQNGICTLFDEVQHAYSYDAAIPSNFLNQFTITQAGALTGPGGFVRGIGLASKAFIVNGTIYVLAVYQSPYQQTYFLLNSTTASPVAKLAYENAGGYLTLGLPNVSLLNGTDCYLPYLYRDLITPANKGTAVTGQTAGIFSQYGIRLAKLSINSNTIDTAEIGNNLLISGGFLWMYDGYLPVEQNFFLYPDSVEAAGSGTAGSMTAQQYYYQVTYEWSDNQGNIHRSAPSIPVTVTLTSQTAVALNIPTLRLTYKTANPVKIVIYRWSVANPIYYQVTSLTSPLLNSTSTDSVSFTDTSSDATILGSSILYTNGGVVENINAPGSNIFTLFDTRFWLVDAEDQNLLWFSKQVIESTPVEMSDLFTRYIAPTTAAQGSTGPITALAPMDDKLILFKANAIYYINGTGPDNTGVNNQYSEPIFITSTVGCENQNSIVFQNQGLMFQSQKGIWLLGRDLSTSYIGAEVENFNQALVQSAVNVPETNQVRFTLSSGQTLMYDYFYEQWAPFKGIAPISSCIFEELHTFVNSSGQIFQESPNTYLDGTSPVLLSLTTAWINLAGLQGYQRAYFFYLLGQYYSPHKLQISIAYDYDPAPTQVSLIEPINFSPPLGADSPLGQGTPYGGQNNVEQWRIFLTRQRCQALQISIQEIYDPSFGITAGQGFTLSGINLVYGAKSRFRPQPAKTSIGGGT